MRQSPRLSGNSANSRRTIAMAAALSSIPRLRELAQLRRGIEWIQCRLLAQNRHGVMSELSPLCAQKRTWITAVGVCNLRVLSLDSEGRLAKSAAGESADFTS